MNTLDDPKKRYEKESKQSVGPTSLHKEQQSQKRDRKEYLLTNMYLTESH